MSFVLCVTNNDKHLFKSFEKKNYFLENLDGMLHRYYMHSDVCDILKSYITLMCVIRRGCTLFNSLIFNTDSFHGNAYIVVCLKLYLEDMFPQ